MITLIICVSLYSIHDSWNFFLPAKVTKKILLNKEREVWKGFDILARKFKADQFCLKLSYLWFAFLKLKVWQHAQSFCLLDLIFPLKRVVKSGRATIYTTTWSNGSMRKSQSLSPKQSGKLLRNVVAILSD